MKTNSKVISARRSRGARHRRELGGRGLLRDYIETPDYIGESEKPGRLIARVGPDPVYLILFLILLTVGTVMSFSASSAYAEQQYGDSYHFLKEHLLHMAVGAVAVAAMMFITPTTMRYMSVGMYFAVIVLLLLVLAMGVVGGGAQRWISIFGLFNFQPSEAAKTAVILIISLHMSRWDNEINSAGKSRRDSFVYGFLIPCIMLGIVVVLVGLEKHFSGVIIITAIGCVTMLFGGTQLRWFVSMLPPAAGLGVIIMNTDYARKRVESWLYRGADALGSDWQSTQGLYAIGTGGMFGLGLGQSRLKYGYVSQPQNDFVFTIVCEELGFCGAVAIMLLFLALISRGFVLAARASDKFCSLVIFGLSFKLALQVLLNIAVVTGVIFNTGISLPYFSTGGTATIMQMFEAGIVLGLSRFCTQQRA